MSNPTITAITRNRRTITQTVGAALIAIILIIPNLDAPTGAASILVTVAAIVAAGLGAAYNHLRITSPGPAWRIVRTIAYVGAALAATVPLAIATYDRTLADLGPSAAIWAVLVIVATVVRNALDKLKATE